jgi:hypothetical protein
MGGLVFFKLREVLILLIIRGLTTSIFELSNFYFCLFTFQLSTKQKLGGESQTESEPVVVEVGWVVEAAIG